MSTFIINLNDTIAMSDSAVVELAKVISSCQPCVQEVVTNANDVTIAKYICLAVAFVALVVGATILLWKWLGNRVDEEERIFKKGKEQEESKRKQESDLLDKKLEMLKTMCDIDGYKRADDETKEKYYAPIDKFIKAIDEALSKCNVDGKKAQ